MGLDLDLNLDLDLDVNVDLDGDMNLVSTVDGLATCTAGRRSTPVVQVHVAVNVQVYVDAERSTIHYPRTR